jgi:hypothetical protein
MIKNNSDKNRPSSSGIQYRQYSPGKNDEIIIKKKNIKNF